MPRLRLFGFLSILRSGSLTLILLLDDESPQPRHLAVPEVPDIAVRVTSFRSVFVLQRDLAEGGNEVTLGDHSEVRGDEA